MTLTPQGLVTLTPQELYADALQEANANVTGFQSLPSGLINNLLQTQVIAEMQMQDLTATLFNGIAPQFSNDQQFLNWGSTFGVTQIPQTQSSVILTFTGPTNTMIPQGTKASTGTGITPAVTVATVQNVTIGTTGSVSVLARSVSPSFDPIQANTVTNMVTALTGVTVNNTNAGVQGEPAESLTAYKQATYNAVQTNLYGSLVSAYKLLHAVEGVSQRLVKINFGEVTTGTPPNEKTYTGINAIVGGGTNADVANALATAFGYIGFISSPSGSETDRTIEEILTIYNTTFPVKFTRPKLYQTGITVSISLTGVTSTPDILTSALKPTMEDYIISLQLGDRLNEAGLSDTVYEALKLINIKPTNIATLSFAVTFNGNPVSFNSQGFLPLFDDTYMTLTSFVVA